MFKAFRCVERFRQLQGYRSEMDRATPDIGDPDYTPHLFWIVGWIIRHRHIPLECHDQLRAISKVVKDA